MTVPKLGVGVTYVPGLEPLLHAARGLFDLIEVEPQTVWRRTGAGCYFIDEELLEGVRALGVPFLLHSVGTPVGSSTEPDPPQGEILGKMARRLSVPWLSEHLSFAHVQSEGRQFFAGLLLPPCQTNAGVGRAATAIRRLSAEVGVPVAVENGANYLRPLANEIEDGAFVGAVAEEADCGILLDIHNAWTNARNGRQSVESFVAQLPLERVWEVHLAGGFEMKGFWIDAHSGPTPREIIAIAAEILPRLPNLGAVVFEVMPSFVERHGVEPFVDALRQVRELWDRCGEQSGRKSTATATRGRSSRPAASDAGIKPADWEITLARMAVGGEVGSALGRQFAEDPGLDVIRTLVREGRASVLVDALPLTTRLMTLASGVEGARAVLRKFWAAHPPEPFGAAEAAALGRHLAHESVDVPFLEDVLTYELARADAISSGRPGHVDLDHDPAALLSAIADGRMPSSVARGNFSLEVPCD